MQNIFLKISYDSFMRNPFSGLPGDDNQMHNFYKRDMFLSPPNYSIINNNTVYIRDYKNCDKKACLDIIAKTMTSWDYDQALNDFNSVYEKNNFVVEVNNTIVGFAGYYPPKKEDTVLTPYDDYLFKVRDAVCLDWGAILPEYQKLEIGKKMFRHCEVHAHKKGKKIVATWTIVPEYFKKLGYTRAIGYDECDDGEYGAVLMIKRLG